VKYMAQIFIGGVIAGYMMGADTKWGPLFWAGLVLMLILAAVGGKLEGDSR
jgi:uncharacterized protein (DUF983 family)